MPELEKKRTRRRTAGHKRSLAFKADDDSLMASRALEEKDDPFLSYSGPWKLLTPPYAFVKVYQIYEESDVLQRCVKAMQRNIDGFGHTFQYLGKDKNERTNTDAQAQKTKLKNFFDFTNEDEGFTKIRKKCRGDYEVLGNAAMEIIRNGQNKISRIYYLPCRSMRMTALQEPYEVDVVVPREGNDSYTMKVKKRFRKFAQWRANQPTPIWFKEFGDPRKMDFRTGNFEDENGGNPIDPNYLASEVLWFKQEFAGFPYGMPRWIGAVLCVKGRRSAQYINFDLMRTQGIPPFLVTVSNGTLTDDSKDQLEAMIDGWRGTERFNRAAIMESTPESSGLEDKGTAKIEVKSLAGERKEDLMFSGYLQETDNDIQSCFNLPAGYTRSNVSISTQDKNMADEQVFAPERADFDEIVQKQLVIRELKCPLYKFKSQKPELVGSDEIMRGVQIFSAVGAMTMNHAIVLANRALGLEMSTLDYDWADIPLNIVMTTLQRGIPLTGLPEFIETDEAKRALFAPPQVGMGGGVAPTSGLAGMLGALGAPNAGGEAGPNDGLAGLLGSVGAGNKIKEDLAALSPEEQAFYSTVTKLEPFLLAALEGRDITLADCNI